MAEKVGKTLFDAARSLMFLIDQVVYWFIPVMYKMIISLANVDLYNNNVIVSAFVSRVYIIVGIFMLFKLAFSILTYIVDPGAFSDQSKGFTNLVKRVLIAFVLLALVPTIFSKLYEYQAIILNSNIISNLILGTRESTPTNMETRTKDLQFLIFSPFFSINYNNSSLGACEPTANAPMANMIGTIDMALGADDGSESCLDAFAKAMDEDETVDASGASIDKYFRSENVDSRDFGYFGGILNMTVDDGNYAINYLPIASTIFGGYLVFLLLSFCIDIAVRAIKLLFLQILSPIAIITSIDPTSSSQNDKLKEWGTECLKVYVSVFLRLIVIFVAIQMVSMISSKIFLIRNDGSSAIYNERFTELDNGALNIWVYIFLVLGTFTVAKKIPELLEKAFGIKMSGEMSLNPFKNFKGNPLFMGVAGAATGAAAGTIAGGLSGGLSAFSTSMNQDRGLGRSILSGAGGIASGGVTGGFRGFRARGAKGFGAGAQSGGRIARRMEVRRATGGPAGIPGMMMDRVRDKMGAPTTYESREARASRYDDVKKNADDIGSYIQGELSTKSNAWKSIQASRITYENAFREGQSVDSATAEERGTYYDEQFSAAQSSYQSEVETLNNMVSSGVDVSSEEYIAQKAAVNRAKAQMDSSEHMLDLYTSEDLTMNQEMYVDLQNAMYQKEQALIEEYYDKGGFEKDSDSKLASKKQALEKAINDTHDKDLGKLDTSKWADVGKSGSNSAKSLSEKKALGIRSEKVHNDARDRDAAIHGAHADAHYKH